ncbi:MAG: glycosyltransferase family 4 protein [Puniceicoccales bacterium]
MRVLVISNLYPPHNVGGYEVRCMQVVDQLRAFGHEVRVLTSDHVVPEADSAGEKDISRRLRIHGYFGHPWLPMHRLYAQEKHNHAVLQEELEAYRPDVVHVWNMGGLSKSLLHRLEAGDVPVQYDVSDHWIARSLRGDVWLAWWNRTQSPLKSLPRAALKLLGFRRRFDKTVPTASWDALRWERIYFCSRFLRELTKKAGFAVDHGEVVYCGIQTKVFEKKQSWEGFSRLLFVGRLSEDKDPLTAIRALALARQGGASNLTLDLYGKGDETYVNSLIREIAHLGLSDAVRFCAVPAARMREVYAEYDALLFTSNWGEPFALTPLEAMAAGLPVIMCPDGGDAELARDGENCLLARAADPESYADAIERMREDPALRERLATAGLREVCEYDIETISRQIEAALQRTVQKESAPAGS